MSFLCYRKQVISLKEGLDLETHQEIWLKVEPKWNIFYLFDFRNVCYYIYIGQKISQNQFNLMQLKFSLSYARDVTLGGTKLVAIVKLQKLFYVTLVNICKLI